MPVGQVLLSFLSPRPHKLSASSGDLSLEIIVWHVKPAQHPLASLFEGGGSRRLTEGVSLFDCNTGKALPQSKIGSEEPILASPLIEGAKASILVLIKTIIYHTRKEKL